MVQKEVLTHEDMMTILCCKKDTAYKVMREIRSVSDILRIKGIIHRKDYEAYLEARKGVLQNRG